MLYVTITGCMPYNDRNIKKMLEKQLQHRLVSFQVNIGSREGGGGGGVGVQVML